MSIVTGGPATRSDHGLGGVFQRVERVLDQVDDDLLQPTRSATTRSRSRRRRSTCDRRRATRSPISSRRRRDRRELDRPDRRRATPGEGAKLGGNRADRRSATIGRDSGGLDRVGLIEEGPAFSAKVRIAATGWLISCATPAVIWPIDRAGWPGRALRAPSGSAGRRRSRSAQLSVRRALLSRSSAVRSVTSLSSARRASSWSCRFSGAI